jgi:tRNA(adenine34) deaminase
MMNRWMEVALQEARQAADEQEVPIGAVAVLEDRLVARDHNRCIQLNDATAHAEILVLREAGRVLSNYRLNGVSLYVTLEPCAMCCGALIWARVSRIVFGAKDEKAGAAGSKVSLLESGLFNHTVEVIEGEMAEESRQILRSFFEERRMMR